MLNELDPQVKALLEQFQANAAQHPAPATPLSAKEKIIALRQMMGAFAALNYPAESVSRTEDFAIPGPAGKIPVRLSVWSLNHQGLAFDRWIQCWVRKVDVYVR